VDLTLIGFIPEMTLRLKHLKVAVKNDFAAITLPSLDNQQFTLAKKILLVTTAQSGMSGMKWTEGQSKFQNVETGRQPLKFETYACIVKEDNP
jgi:hypothetical protein